MVMPETERSASPALRATAPTQTRQAAEAVPAGDAPAGLARELGEEFGAFADAERRRLGLERGPAHWQEAPPPALGPEARSRTTLLFGGLTAMHDAFIEAAMAAQGYRVKALECPTNEAHQLGKEFGNRAQCNPTYFTSGNLLRHLMRLRDEEGWRTEDIIDRHVFITFSACGPCRFGTYVTEYRKALRDAGFEGFRVVPLEKRVDIGAQARENGLALTPRFYLGFLKAVIAGDVVNAMGYRIRPYEVVPGATDAALARCKAIVCDALSRKTSVRRALRRCRRELGAVKVDYLRPKPKVSIIGEFWAMTTEGDGNYGLQRFLEAEGAECEVQLLTAWILYEVWCLRSRTLQRMMLRRRAEDKHRRDSARPLTALFALRLTSALLKRWFNAYARALGLTGYRLPDMDELARLSRDWYPSELYGGEGHMEVGKVVDIVRKEKAHMVISVKPFGCMPSSGVSDGVQSLVTARYPDANFCPVETSGDAAVSVYSRIQMVLFKARARAQAEFETMLAGAGLSAGRVTTLAARRRRGRTRPHYPSHVTACTGANAVHELVGPR